MVAIHELGRDPRGDLQRIDVNPQAVRPHPPNPLLLARRMGNLVVGDTPTSPARALPLQPFPGSHRTDVVGHVGRLLVQCYAPAEQVPLTLNTS